MSRADRITGQAAGARESAGQIPGQDLKQSAEEQSPGTGAATIALPVLGMSCAACQRHVEQALNDSPGVVSARVDLMRHRARVEFDPRITQPTALVQAIRDSGYDSALPRMADSVPAPMKMDSMALSPGLKAAVTILAGALAMLFSMPLGVASDSQMGGFDHGLMQLLPWMYALPVSALRWTILIVTAVLAIWAGRGIYLSAWKALLHGETNMNTLVSLGTGVAFFYSAYVTVWPNANGNVYFDSVLLILGFLLLGKWLEGRARHRALDAVDALARLQPATARVRRSADSSGNPVEEILPLEQVKVGDLVVVLPGERFPVDAVIESGRTSVDESMLTGEALPLARGVGERVLAGSVNYDGAVACVAEQVGVETVLAQIGRLVEQAQGSRAPMERLADRASAVFVPIVLGLAVLTLLGWLIFAHSLPLAIANTVAVLVIACPCAMGLAVPAALTVAIGRGAQFGVLIKGGEALERVSTLQTILMDKTGTLTIGRPVLAGIHSLSTLADKDLLRIAAAAEDHSAHPLAHAIVDQARALGLSWQPATEAQIISGRGLTAQIEGQRCLLGNLAYMQEEFIPMPATLPVEAAGVTRLWMALDGELVGYFDAKDALRLSAKSAVAWLRGRGLQVEMLTGDSASAAAPIAAAVGISQVAAGLMPADKLARIRELQQSGLRVAMVGDGINDAAAMAQADAGIAMGAGAALAQEAGDVLLLNSDPIGICTALGLSRATIAVMRQNLGWAAGYNVIGIPLAAGLLYPAFHILLTPWMAAAAMAFSSVSVLLNSLRLRGWKQEIIN
ncbi:heavy metal translocating P-type ATPase [Acidicapsa ligni]|uniref:heavy metal translocating P-type ATPase n=1 Tax=Acidicapsa ligni TaxID=542300 RepID=UPI0021DF54B8|nr:heavy metal translocating P-type ATPase [Acidicapsa ligni]